MTDVWVFAGSVVFAGLLGVFGDLANEELRVRFRQVRGDTSATVRLIAVVTAGTGLLVAVVATVAVVMAMSVGGHDATYLGCGIACLTVLLNRAAGGSYVLRRRRTRTGSGTAD